MRQWNPSIPEPPLKGDAPVDSYPLRANNPNSHSNNSSSNKPEWLEQYDVIGKIGEGTYGLVFLAKVKSNRSKPIAIKKFKQSKNGDGVSPSAIREIMNVKAVFDAAMKVVLQPPKQKKKKKKGQKACSIL